MTQEHIDSDLIAAYAERRLSSTDRTVVEAHLAGCAECRADLTHVAGEVSAVRRRRSLLRAAPLVAAAAVLAVVVVLRPGPEPVAVQALRPGGDGDRDRLNSLAALLPTPGAAVSRMGLRFAWQTDGPDAVYEVTLADSSGAALWRARTPDTTIQLPDSVRLAPGAKYHWWVDVLLSDGRVASTGVRDFSLLP
jgi:anti-sigma factor ChrR (cupin superfamily)